MDQSVEYLDFDLRIGERASKGYPVTVVRSPVGEASAICQLSLDDPNFKRQLQMMEQIRGFAIPSRKSGDVERHMRRAGEQTADEHHVAEKIGHALFEAFLPAKVLSCYRRSLDAVAQAGKSLRIRLRIEAPDLAVLPWEYLFDEEEGDHLCLNKETPVTRYLELSRPIESLTIPPPIRILAMIASPRDLATLDVAEEKRRLIAAIDHLIEKRIVELTWLEGQTVDALDRALRNAEQPWHIFHFIGHGGFNAERGEGMLALVNPDDGNTHFITARETGRLFVRHPSLRLIILNACEGARASETKLFSSTGAVLAQRGIPAVVSMQYAITDRAALEFTRNFYDALAHQLPVDGAIGEMRYKLSLKLNHSTEWGTPVLHMRAPDGKLFDLDETQTLFLESEATPQPVPRPELERAPAPETNHDLQILRRKVQQSWIEGVLENSLFQRVLIDLGMTQEYTAVENIWLERPAQKSQPLPPKIRISDVFAEEGNSLLILGEPGSGKTTTMLELARDLLAQSDHDPTHPIPGVFNLSSWQRLQHEIIDWLADELSTKYQIPKRIGRSWLQEGRLLPLLDGLDELQEQHRAACVEAINRFAQNAPLMGTVVCCRLREYIELPVRLTLNAAVRLQQLTDVQVDMYLERVGEPLAALRMALEHDSAMRIDARSPLMLNLMVSAYRGVSPEDVLREGVEPIARRRQQLMDAYVARMARQAGLE